MRLLTTSRLRWQLLLQREAAAGKQPPQRLRVEEGAEPEGPEPGSGSGGGSAEEEAWSRFGAEQVWSPTGARTRPHLPRRRRMVPCLLVQQAAARLRELCKTPELLIAPLQLTPIAPCS
jgi:hypothetical protein